MMWLEELISHYQIDISKVSKVNQDNINQIKQFLDEWKLMRNKRLKREITYAEYIKWKLTYEVK